MLHHVQEASAILDFWHSLRSLELEIGIYLGNEMTCSGMTTAQCHFVLEASANPGASLGDLAKALVLDPSTVSRTAEALVSCGLVVREAVPGNRRKVVINLTESGTSKVAAIFDSCRESCCRLLESFPEPGRGSILEAATELAQAMRMRRLGETGRCCGFLPRRLLEVSR
ncbi:MAG: hypothetical protein CVV51_12125 [Spirochaetae bacterium HGW-Spirochaetae-7]|jgi:DNA-binding MarR family transcriptional regulator|nr:MAG: hypothetical protein CVV51_12125 [Spirochaetae bacterium HGW-Spirochaetae-7]